MPAGYEEARIQALNEWDEAVSEMRKKKDRVLALRDIINGTSFVLGLEFPDFVRELVSEKDLQAHYAQQSLRRKKK